MLVSKLSGVKSVTVFASIVTALLLVACTTEPKDDAGGSTGGGDFDVAAGARFGDTAYTPGLVKFDPLDTLRGDYSRVDTIGYTVTGNAFVYRVGDSTKSASFGSFVQVGVGTKNAASGTYDVYGHDADYRTPRSGLSGKVRLYVSGLGNLGSGLAWSHPDSTVGAKVKVVVTGDSVQVIGKSIKLSNGRTLSFNFKTRKAY